MLVALGLLMAASPADLDEMDAMDRHLKPGSPCRAFEPDAPLPHGVPDGNAPSPPVARGGRGSPAATRCRRARRGMTPSLASLEYRLRQQQKRLLIRSWEYRQRRHTHGVWFRLRRVLANAGAAYVIWPRTLEHCWRKAIGRSRLARNWSRPGRSCSSRRNVSRRSRRRDRPLCG